MSIITDSDILSLVNKQKGFAPIFILVGILIIAAVAGGAYYFGTMKSNDPTSTPAPTVVTQITQPAPSSNPSDETANWKTYKESAYKFTIKYPENWIITPYDYIKFPVSSSDQEQLLVSFANKNSEGITLGDKERIEINVNYVNPKVSFNEYLDQKKKEAQDSIPPTTNISEKDVLVAEVNSKQIVYAYSELITTFIYIPKVNGIYIISNPVLKGGKVSESAQFLNQILSTFRFD